MIARLLLRLLRLLEAPFRRVAQWMAVVFGMRRGSRAVEGVPINKFREIPPEVRKLIFIKAGSWKASRWRWTGTALFPYPERYSAISVCREWRDEMKGDAFAMGDLLIETYGGSIEMAFIKACTSGQENVVRHLGSKARARWSNDSALLKTAEVGHDSIVRLLLELPEDAPRADCCDGKALVSAAGNGHETIVRLLLGWPEHAPRADCLDGQALEAAAGGGHDSVVRLLLEWPLHAPRANTRIVINRAVVHCHESTVRMLLEWPEHAPRADFLGGQLLLSAVRCGRDSIAKMLLGWPEHAPRADVNDGEALMLAVGRDNVSMVRTLLEWPEHAPRADCRNGEAFRRAKGPEMIRLLTDFSRRQGSPFRG